MVFSPLAASSISHQWGEVNEKKEKNKSKWKREMGKIKVGTGREGWRKGWEWVGNLESLWELECCLHTHYPGKDTQAAPSNMRQNKVCFHAAAKLGRVLHEAQGQTHKLNRKADVVKLQPKLHVSPTVTTANWGQWHHQGEETMSLFSPHIVFCTHWKTDSSCYHGIVSSLVSEQSCRHTEEKDTKSCTGRWRRDKIQQPSQTAPLEMLWNSYNCHLADRTSPELTQFSLGGCY